MDSNPGSSSFNSPAFDYAWKWFEFHADQRTKMFNFMLVGFGIFATAIFGALEKNFYFGSFLLSVAAVVVAWAFLKIDSRNRELYLLAQKVLVDAEKRGEFGFGFAIASSRTVEIEKDAFWTDLKNNKHRALMPFVAYVFWALFVATAFGSVWLVSTGQDLSQSTPVVVCCHGSASDSPPSDDHKAENGGSQRTDVTATKDGAAPTGGLRSGFFLIGMAMVIVGVVIAVLGSRSLGATVAALGMAGALPHISIPISPKFSVEPKWETEFRTEIHTDIDLRFKKLMEIARNQEPALLSSGVFDRFDESGYDFKCDNAGYLDSFRKLNAGIEDAQKRNLQLVVLLVGGTDRKPLSAAYRKQFESNSGLARARVSTVENCLHVPPISQQPQDQVAQVIRVITGPSYTPASKNPANLATAGLQEDRRVDAFIFGFPRGR